MSHQHERGRGFAAAQALEELEKMFTRRGVKPGARLV